MSGIVYILKSDNEKYYVGSTTDINRRMDQHRSGHTLTTKRLGNMRLVFSQEFNSLKDARIIERRIKSWKRKDFIDKIVSDGFIRIRVE